MSNLYPLLAKKKSAGFTYPYDIPYSCKFDAAVVDILYTTNAAAPLTTDGKKVTAHFGMKKTSNGTQTTPIGCLYDASHAILIYITASDQIAYYSLVAGVLRAHVITTAVFRDTSQHYDVHVIVDSTEAISTDRVKIWVNGVEQATTGTYPGLNVALFALTWHTWSPRVGSYTTLYAFDGYISNLHIFDGNIVPVTEFGEFVNNTWVRKEFILGSYSYGNTGYALDFSDSENLGKDVSGNGRDLSSYYNTPTQSEDTPTNNFITWDNLSPLGQTVSLGGLRVTTSVATYNLATVNMVIPKTGIWQCEFDWQAGPYCAVGVVDPANRSVYNLYISNTGNKYVDSVPSAYGASFTTSNIIGMVINSNTGEVTFYKDGASQGVAMTLDMDSNDWALACFDFDSGNSTTVDIVNGSEGFNYEVTGALPICTANWPLEETPILDSEQGIWIPTWSGDNTVSRDITGCQFDVTQKSIVWQKSRAGYAGGHSLYDTERGAGNDKELRVDSNYTEGGYTNETYGYLSAFLTNGFTLAKGTAADGCLLTNKTGVNYVAWALNMVAKYGMDIVKHTGNAVSGTQINHSLGRTPELRITKNRDSASNWAVQCKYLTSWDYYILLNSSTAQTLNANVFGGTPTSTYFTVGTGTGGTNNDGDKYVTSLFCSIPGFLKVGYYVGNNSANGPRIYTGFRPRFILQRSIGITGTYWTIHDSVRKTYNVIGPVLYPNLPNAEQNDLFFDFLSNGFKLRGAGTGYNSNGGVHIYLAIADMPYPYCNAF